MGKIQVRAPFAYDAEKASDESGLKCEDISLTQQHQKEEADINVIVKRFGLTGEMPLNPRIPMYGDFTGITDYRTALEAVKFAEEEFMRFPAEIRAEFNHDPQKLLEAFYDVKEKDRLIRLGLIRKEEQEAVVSEGSDTKVVGVPPVAGGLETGGKKA